MSFSRKSRVLRYIAYYCVKMAILYEILFILNKKISWVFLKLNLCQKTKQNIVFYLLK